MLGDTLRVFRLWIFGVLFILMAVSVYSNSEMTNVCNSDGYCNAGITRFNSNYLEQFGMPNVYSVGVSQPNSNPVIGDIDNDGNNEIIIMSGGNMNIYRGKQLNLINAVPIGSDTDVYSNVILFDVDGDGYLNPIVADRTRRNISIIKINAVNVTLPFYGNITGAYDEMLISCRGNESCFYVQTANNGAASSPYSLLFVGFFNSTHVVEQNSSILSTAPNQRNICFPSVPYIQAVDYDGDTVKEYVFTANSASVGQSNAVPIYYVYVFDVSGSSISLSNSKTATEFTSGGGSLTQGCHNDQPGWLTSPLVMDVNGGVYSEIVFGISKSTETYKMLVLDYQMNEINSHPNYQTADGKMLSNPIKANIFPVDKSAYSDKKNDYCILGNINSYSVLDLLCGSTQSSIHLFDTIEFLVDSKNFNITLNHNFPNQLINAISAETDYIGSNNPDEIITSWGVFRTSDDNCDNSDLCNTASGCIGGISCCSYNNQCKLYYSFENGVFDSLTMPIDYEKVGIDDYVSLTNSALYYIDDKYSNSAPVLCPTNLDCAINPCFNSVWLKNTTVGITLKATDVDNDNVAYNAIMYYGTPYQFETGWTANVSSGTTMVINTIANVSIGVGTIRLQSTDSNNPLGHLQNRDISFSVSDTSGYVYGDCTSFLSGSGSAVLTGNETNIFGVNVQENKIKTALTPIAGYLGVGVIVIYFVLMLVGGIALIFYLHKYFPEMSASIIVLITGISEFLLLMIGIMIGIIGIGILISMIVICIVLIGIYFGRKVGHSDS